jgi:Cu+-exporting ATPase
MHQLRGRKEMMHRRSFIRTLAGTGAGVALLKLGASEARSTGNASVKWTVKGFTCVTCAVGLQTILERQAGIAWVKAEYPSGKVEIGFDSKTLAPAKIKQLIEQAGFRVTEETAGLVEGTVDQS